MKTLPLIMVAPNGAHRTKKDHPQLPISIDETVQTAIACYQAGAGALHAHIRDKEGKHCLDSGLYNELLQELYSRLPQLDVQITTEAVGQYSAPYQRQLVRDVLPPAASCGLRELLSDGDEGAARRFYHEMVEIDIYIQHILYDAADVALFKEMVKKGVIPEAPAQMIFVLGRYSEGQESKPSDLNPFLQSFSEEELAYHDWSVCAFGVGETEALLSAYRAGGKCRVGFENSLWLADGEKAQSNEDKVAKLAALLCNA